MKTQNVTIIFDKSLWMCESLHFHWEKKRVEIANDIEIET
jgi:hypothetical protein